MRIGLIVNPIAGIGGAAGLKGSDDRALVAAAQKQGFSSPVRQRIGEALAVLQDIKGSFELYSAPAVMGEAIAQEQGFAPRVIGKISSAQTTAEDTSRLAAELKAAGCDLILFGGGDGTARDIAAAVADLPCLGIPSGVKMHSACFAATPRRAGEVVKRFINGQCQILPREIMDIDEGQFRSGRVSAKLYGYLMVPVYENLLQGKKNSGVIWEAAALQNLARGVIAEMEAAPVGTLFIFGPGTTTAAVFGELGLNKTLLGVDVLSNKEVIAADCNEQDLKRITQNKSFYVFVTPIGGQGYIFGRGNQQISAELLINAAQIRVIAVIDKLISLPEQALIVDTGNEAVNQGLRGFCRVLTGYGTEAMIKII